MAKRLEDWLENDVRDVKGMPYSPRAPLRDNSSDRPSLVVAT